MFQCQEEDCTDADIEMNHMEVDSVTTDASGGVVEIHYASTRTVSTHSHTHTDPRWLRARVGDYVFATLAPHGTCMLIALMMMSNLDCILPCLPACLQHVLTVSFPASLPVCSMP